MSTPDYGVRPCCMPDCEALLSRIHELPVCHSCGVKIAVAHLHDATRLHAVQAESRRQFEEHRDRMKAGLTTTACVYYLKLAPDKIKIGFTSHLEQRVRDLRAHPADLLAIEPGGRDVEKQRHAEFAAERITTRREDFHYSIRLAEHIEGLSRMFSLPVWAKVPDLRAVRRQA